MNDIDNFVVKLISPEMVDKDLVDGVNELLRQLSEESRRQTVEQLKEYVGRDHVYQFGAFAGHRLVGLATLVVVERIELTGGQLEGVVVLKAYRRRGLGKRLSLAAIDKGRELGLRHIELTSRPSRVAAHRLYESLGFKKRKTAVYRLEY